MEQSVHNELETLSKLLRLTMLNEKAFDKAVEQGYIEVREDGTMEWMLESKTLLAYFCGRIWCGDYGKYSRRVGSTLWQLGDGVFPSARLERLFSVSLLRQTRNKRKNLALPEYHQLIDILFVND